MFKFTSRRLPTYLLVKNNSKVSRYLPNMYKIAHCENISRRSIVLLIYYPATDNFQYDTNVVNCRAFIRLVTSSIPLIIILYCYGDLHLVD